MAGRCSVHAEGSHQPHFPCAGDTNGLEMFTESCRILDAGYMSVTCCSTIEQPANPTCQATSQYRLQLAWLALPARHVGWKAAHQSGMPTLASGHHAVWPALPYSTAQ